MPHSGTPGAPAPRFVSLPVALVAGLNAHVASSAGDERVRDLGYSLGAPLFQHFGAWLAERGHAAPETLEHTMFLALLPEFFAGLGWGRVAFHPLSEAVLAMDAVDWMEASTAGTEGCLLSTGALAGFFGQVSDAPIAVLEVACHAAGATHCRFLLGSVEVLDALHEAVAAGASVEEAAQLVAA